MKIVKFGWGIAILLSLILVVGINIIVPEITLIMSPIALGITLGFLFYHLLETVEWDLEREENVTRDLLIILGLIINFGFTIYITFF